MSDSPPTKKRKIQYNVPNIKEHERILQRLLCANENVLREYSTDLAYNVNKCLRFTPLNI